MVCASCGSANPDDVKFCGQCGKGISRGDQVETVVLEGAATAAALTRTQYETGVLSPPPDATQSATWGVPRVAAAPIDLQSGSAFGSRYRIEALLGEGGMGAVYRAYDSELGRIVALKLVRPELASSPQTMKRFKQELLLASKISHKNILRIHDLGDVNGVKFITMALVEGADLANVIEKIGRLPFDRALNFAKQLCAALDAAHSEGVVHRDLKPQNILVDQADHVYVSDFGLAKSLEAEATLLTRTGQILGTPRYMSPEQVEGGVIDHRSDIYSLGLIFYEMFTSDVPFRGESTLQLMYQRINERPKDPRTVCPDLPPYVANIILKCLEKDAAKRYQQAREILADLESATAPEVTTPGLRPRDATRTISIQLPQPSRRWWLSTAAIVLLAIAALFATPVTRGWIFRSQGGVQHYLAVLPFRVADNADTTRYAADGVVDSLSAKLSGLRNVYVASANAVNGIIDKRNIDQQDPAKIARALGVTMLLSGTVQSSGDNVAFTISLDQTGKNAGNLLHRDFEGKRADLLTLEDNAFKGLVSALEIRPSNDELARTSTKPTEDSAAYELYLKGRSLFSSAQSVESLQSAAQLFEDATKSDPRFALAYAGLADTYLKIWDRTKDSVWSQRALGAAQQAQALNDSLPEVHFSLGRVDTYTGKTAEAIAELQRALELAPNSDEALRRLGGAYLAAGQQQEAIAAYAKATQINPYFWQNFTQLGAALFRMGKNDKALAAFQRVTELDPDRASGYANVGAVYLREAKWNDAIPMFQRAIKLQPTPAYYSNLGYAYYFLERYGDAVPMFAKAVEMAPNNVKFRGNLADAYRWSRQRDKAMAAYDQAIDLAYKSYQVNPKDAEVLGELAVFYAKKMDKAKATDFISRAREIDRSANELMYEEAIVHALAGDTALSLSSLSQALHNGYAWNEAAIDPELKSLRARPEFQNLAREYSSVLQK
jgi:eukaryotic-like serine/threonine-protein kinase